MRMLDNLFRLQYGPRLNLLLQKEAVTQGSEAKLIPVEANNVRKPVFCFRGLVLCVELSVLCSESSTFPVGNLIFSCSLWAPSCFAKRTPPLCARNYKLCVWGFQHYATLSNNVCRASPFVHGTPNYVRGTPFYSRVLLSNERELQLNIRVTRLKVGTV